MGIVTLPVFKQEVIRYKNCRFCYLYIEGLFFSDLDFVLMNSFIGKPFQKYARPCYVPNTIFNIKGAQKIEIFNFHPILMQFLENDYLHGLLMGFKDFWYVISKKGRKF